MSFLEHLDELRKRLIRCVIGIVVGVIVSFAFINKIFAFVSAQLYERLPPGIPSSPLKGPSTSCSTSRWAWLAGLFASMPYSLGSCGCSSRQACMPMKSATRFRLS